MVKKPKGMVAFTIIWSGQVVSLFGSAMISFALATIVSIAAYSSRTLRNVEDLLPDHDVKEESEEESVEETEEPSAPEQPPST